MTPSLTWDCKNMIHTNEIIDRKKEFADIDKWLDLEFKLTRDGHLLRVEVDNVL
jgi:hypothetical protein